MKNGIFFQIKIDKIWAAMWPHRITAHYECKIWFLLYCSIVVAVAAATFAVVVAVACVGLMFALSLHYIKVIT